MEKRLETTFQRGDGSGTSTTAESSKSKLAAASFGVDPAKPPPYQEVEVVTFFGPLKVKLRPITCRTSIMDQVSAGLRSVRDAPPDQQVSVPVSAGTTSKASLCRIVGTVVRQTLDQTRLKSIVEKFSPPEDILPRFKTNDRLIRRSKSMDTRTHGPNPNNPEQVPGPNILSDGFFLDDDGLSELDAIARGGLLPDTALIQFLVRRLRRDYDSEEEVAKMVKDIICQALPTFLPACATAYPVLKDAPNHVRLAISAGLVIMFVVLYAGMLSRSLARRWLAFRLASCSAVTLLIFSFASQLSGPRYIALTAVAGLLLNLFIMLLRF